MMPNAALRGKIGVITGASRGIGAAIARSLCKEGLIAVICGRNRKALNATADAIRSDGGQCEPVVCDVMSLTDVQALADHVQSTLARIDVLVNNAGVGAFSVPLHELPPDEWERVLNTNLRGAYYTIRSFAPLMIASGGGDIVNISSIAGKNALPNGAAYAASKWGLNGLSYSVAEELRQHRIRVSVICPGSTATELSPHDGRDTSRMLKPADVAHVVRMIVTQTPQSFASEIVLRPTQKP
jgi:NAD(P)-dependent dehydrogenase (short-subunit alcohol dehydrogenase family)